MEEEFYKFVSPAEIAKDLNLPEELATKIHKYWALKRKVLCVPFNRKQIHLSWCVTTFGIYTQSLQLRWLSSSGSYFYSGGCLVYTVLPWNTSFCCVCFFQLKIACKSRARKFLQVDHISFNVKYINVVTLKFTLIDCKGNAYQYGNCLLLLAGMAWNFCCGIQLW